MADDFTPNQEQTLLLAKARRRRAEAGGAPSADATPKSEDLSLGAGVWEAGKTAAKAAASLPVFAYEQIRHPIQTEKDVLSGVADIPADIKKRADADTSSAIEDAKQVIQNPDDYQKALHGGRAVLTALGLPFDAVLGGVLEPTYGKAVGRLGVLTAQDAAALPIAGLGAKAVQKTLPPGVKAVAQDMAQNLPKLPPESKAALLVMKNLRNTEKATGVTPEETLRIVKEARAAGKPMSLADADQNVRRMAGTVFRKGDTGRAITDQALKQRDAEAADRITKSNNKYLGSGSVYQTIDDLAEVRSEQGAPLWERAMQGREVGALENQYQRELAHATERADIASITVANWMKELSKQKAKVLSGYDKEAQQKVLSAEFKIGEAEKELKQAHADTSTTLEHLRQTTADRAAGAGEGGVWTPHLQRLMANSLMKAGMTKGVQILRNFADARNLPFKLEDYALIAGKEGELTVGKVPTMRLLAAAKEGLDNILSKDEMYDEQTGRLTKEGLSVTELRDSLVKELDRINPDYKTAREAWAGESAKIRSVNMGQRAFKMHPEEIAKQIGKMTESEKEFARLGLADKIREKLLSTKLNGDEAKALINNEWTKMRLRPFFKNNTDFNAFVKDVTEEKTMFESGVDIARQSLTADRAAADSAAGANLALNAGGMAIDASRGALMNVFHKGLTMMKDRSLRNNPQINEMVARMLWDPTMDMSSLDKALAHSKKK